MSIGLLLGMLIVVAVVGAGWWFVRANLRGKPEHLLLEVGDALPDFAAITEDGGTVRSTDLHGKPSVILFVRGNWCPFCTRQVADLAGHYQQINTLGARLIFITPKPLDTTRRVAEIFDVEFEFWLDADLSIARELGLVHQAGVPGKHRETHGKDTVWPTALVCDTGGIVRYVSQSRRIMDRPDPAIFVAELRKLS